MASLTDESLNEILNSEMRKRIEEHGETDSGAYRYYADRVERGCMLHPMEIRLASLVHEIVPRNASIHEIGAGVGTLAMAFALRGHVAHAVEKDSRRAKAGTALWASAAGADHVLAGHLRFVEALFPSLESRRARDSHACSVVIATNVIGTMTDQQETLIIEELSSYHAATLNLCKLRTPRQKENEKEELSERIMSAGWKSCEDLIRGGDYHYRIFRH